MKKIAFVLAALLLFVGVAMAGPPGAPPSGWYIDENGNTKTDRAAVIGTSSFRDNAGQMQVSNGGGVWQNLPGTGGEGVDWTADQSPTFSIHINNLPDLSSLYLTPAAAAFAYQAKLAEGAFEDGDKTKLDSISWPITSLDIGLTENYILVGNSSNQAAPVALATALSGKQDVPATGQFVNSVESNRIYVLDDCTTATGMQTGDICLEY